MSERRVLVLDNGAYTIKAGYASITQQPRYQLTQLMELFEPVTLGKGDKKTYIGDQINSCTDFSGLYYRLPFERV
ncbi:17522_t:CDS:2, partial [Acaulospora morrowiae]